MNVYWTLYAKVLSLQIEMTQQLSLQENNAKNQPKSSNGYRFIPVSPSTMKLIEEAMLQSKYKKPTDFVFANGVGKAADKHTLRRLIKRVARRSGVYDIAAIEA